MKEIREEQQRDRQRQQEEQAATEPHHVLRENTGPLKMKMGGYYITFVSSPELGNAGVVLYSHPHSHLLHLDEISKFGPRRKFR